MHRARWPLATFVGLVLVGAIIFIVPRLIYPPLRSQQLDQLSLKGKARLDARNDRFQLQNDLRATLVQGLAGLAVLAGGSVAYRQLRHNIQASSDQHALDERGQVTERFGRAIDQLGHDQLDVRLGGIYALERIARDSPLDRLTIYEVLTAFVRGHAPWPPRLPGQYRERAPIGQLPELQVRAPDIQAAMTVLSRRIRVGIPPPPPRPTRLGRRKRAQPEEPRWQYARIEDPELDLHGVDLRRLNLTRAILNNAHLYGAHLEGANLTEANLYGAHLYGAHLEGALLYGAHLDSTKNLTGAHLRGAHADGTTTWPTRPKFNWQKAGVVMRSDDR